LVEFVLAAETASRLAIQDSNTGAKSAETAGCSVAVVANRVPVLDGHPEQSTDAFVLHHPEAKYFNV
jgi:beta-phosphoglucomutase-like phosphatase (HAD superfamily)